MLIWIKTTMNVPETPSEVAMDAQLLVYEKS